MNQEIEWQREFPGLSVPHKNVLAQVEGDLFYGNDVYVGPYSQFIVPVGSAIRLGDDVKIGQNVELNTYGAEKSVIEIGDRTTVQNRCLFIGDVKIGRYCVFSLNVYISSGRHYYRHKPHLLIRDQDLDVFSTEDGRASHSRPVVIGEDCWFGINSVVMPGLKIGRGAVIGANSVVTHDVAPYTVVAGSPARQIGTRLEFSPPERISWKNEEDIPYFYSGFELAADQRLKNEPMGGHQARTGFSVWLSGNGGNINLKIRSIGEGVTNIKNTALNQEIGQEWSLVQVPRSCKEEEVFGVDNQGVVVSDAWISD